MHSSRELRRQCGARLLRLALLCCAFFVTLQVRGLQTVTLAWDGNTNVAGYKIYYGVTSRNYTNVQDVGNVTTASVANLREGVTYYFAATAYDAEGTESFYSSEVVHAIPAIRAPISISTVGSGSFGPLVNGQLLDVDRSYTVTATPATGHAFSNWSGSISASTRQLTFVMQSNLALVATFYDNTAPLLAITSPSANLRLTNASITISGTASDNVGVNRVLWRVGGSAFQPATGTTAWSFTTPPMTAGVNTFQVKSVDAAGNESTVATRTITNVIGSVLTVSTTGNGAVSPNYNGQWLEVGRTYTLTASAAAGFVFTNWTGSVSAISPQVTFVMQPNFTLSANFVDVAKPTIVLSSPAANVVVTNSSVTLQGSAGDNAAVSQVLYAINAAPFQPANGTLAWSAPVTLTSKTNLIRVKSVDSTGNESAIISRSITYSPKNPLRLAKRGKGYISPDLNNQWLEIGATYTMTAVPEAGYTFSDWSGSAVGTSARLTFVMQSNLTFTATFVDSAKPGVTIISPAANARLMNNVVTLLGRATDNREVAQVLYSLNDQPFQAATGTSNWSAAVTLRAGPNVIRVKSVDLGGLESPVLSRTLTYVVLFPIQMAVTGKGTVSPVHGQRLEIGKTYTALARPGVGYVLTNWTGGIATNRAQFNFIMQSNLALHANFVDVMKPVVSIVSPAVNARLTNDTITLQGRATDNAAVVQVFYQLNDAPFELADGTTSWSSTLRLRAGLNSVRVKAVDVTGFESLIVSRAFTYVVMYPLNVNITGLGRTTPTNNQRLEIGKTYSAVALPNAGFVLTNWTGSVSTNRASFNFVMQSNLTFNANFVDVAKPIVSIASPLANARLTNGTVTLWGRASDNYAVARVLYGVNNGPWLEATGTTNWSASIDLPAGPNRIRARAIDVTGFESAAITQAVTYVVMEPILVSTNGRGLVSPNLNGQKLEIGKRYTMTALPSAGHLFSNWVGSVSADIAALSFTMVSNMTLTAQFVPNPFIATKGDYHGLFYETDGVLHESSGFLRVSVTDRGSFSASLVGSGVTVPFTGQFDLAGHARKIVPRAGRLPVTIDLELALDGDTRQITGTISDGAWTAEYLADRSLWNTTNNPHQGKYTLVIPGAAGQSNTPAGHGHGTVMIDRAGNLLFSGRSADGQLVSQSVPVSRRAEWPLYLPLYTAKGSMLSWVTFTNQTDEHLGGLLSWIRPANVMPPYYQRGFTNEALLTGSTFIATNPIVKFTNGIVIVTDGNLPQPVTNYVTFTPPNLIRTTNSAHFSMSLDVARNLMSGTFVAPGTTVRRTYYGALLQSRDAGYGYFLGTNQSGQVLFQAAP